MEKYANYCGSDPAMNVGRKVWDFKQSVGRTSVDDFHLRMLWKLTAKCNCFSDIDWPNHVGLLHEYKSFKVGPVCFV